MAKRTTRRSTRKSDDSYVKFSDKLTDSLEEITRVIQENKETLDSIQDVSLQLVRVANTLEAITTKYAGLVNSVLENAVPILSNIPLVSKKVIGILDEVQEFTGNVLEISTMVGGVIDDVEEGLAKADVVKLQSRSGDLKKITRSLEKVLPDSKR